MYSPDRKSFGDWTYDVIYLRDIRLVISVDVRFASCLKTGDYGSFYSKGNPLQQGRYGLSILYSWRVGRLRRQTHQPFPCSTTFFFLMFSGLLASCWQFALSNWQGQYSLALIWTFISFKHRSLWHFTPPTCLEKLHPWLQVCYRSSHVLEMQKKLKKQLTDLYFCYKETFIWMDTGRIAL